MQLLVLQHIACEPPGVYEDVLRDRGLELQRVEVDAGDDLPDWRGFDGIVAMGGPMSVNDERELPWLRDEKELVADAVRSGLPFWGVCLGVQLLAASLGARVYAGERPEVGVLPVELTDEGRRDPVFGALPQTFPALQWHGDTFELPEGAVPLARSSAYENQAFRFENAYGVQFHLEVSAGMARGGRRCRSTTPRSNACSAPARRRTSSGPSTRAPARCSSWGGASSSASWTSSFERLHATPHDWRSDVGEDVGRRAVLGARVRVGPRLGLYRPPEGAARDVDRAVREGAAREREAVRRRAAVPAAQPRAARRARLPRADRPRGVRRAGREPRRVLDGVRDDRALRLCVDRDVLRDARRRGERDHAAPHAGADRQVHPAAVERQDRNALLLRPGDGLALLVPGLSGAERVNGGFRVRKKASWTTSGGFADFYVVQTTSPDFSGYDDLSVFVIDGEHVMSQPSLWDALGLRGNQSGPIEVQNVEIPGEQLVGPVGDGAASNDESVDPWFLVGSASVWNGIALGAIDIAKRHTTKKRHVDVGMRVADYPTIQDYVGEAVMDTNACRLFVLSVAQAMDRETDDNTRVLAPGELARANYLHWAWQIKFEAAKNVAHVVDKMLHACGGSGYKRDMELERYLRDAKAGWVMGPTNEVLRQFVGKAVLLGFDSLDYWNQTYNRRAVENELKKLDAKGKRELAEQLLAEAEEQAAKEPAKAAT